MLVWGIRNRHDGRTGYPTAIPPDAVLVEAALAPDLDGDGLPEIRARLEADSGEWTVILGSATESPIYLITGREPFDPWAEVLGDVNGDGRVDLVDLEVLIINSCRPEELFVWQAFAANAPHDHSDAQFGPIADQPGSSWHEIALFANGEEVRANSALSGLLMPYVPNYEMLRVLAITRSERIGSRMRFADQTFTKTHAVVDAVRRVPIKERWATTNSLLLLTISPKIYSVDFIQNPSGGLVQMKKDKGTQDDYDSIESQDENGNGSVLDAGDKRAPVCYVSDDFIRMNVKIRYPAGTPLNKDVLRIVGADVDGTSSFATVQPTVAVSNEGGYTVLSATVYGSGASTIDVWDEHQFSWVVEEFDPQTGQAVARTNVGTSKHTIYFIRNLPLLTKAQAFHTVVDIACRGAQGLGSGASDVEVVESFWAVFSTNSIKRAQDEYEQTPSVILKYYGDWAIGNVLVEELLAEADGECNSWAELMLNCMWIHGIDFHNEYVTLSPNPVPDIPVGFMVINWSVYGGPSNEHFIYGLHLPWLNIPDDAGLFQGNSVQWLFRDIDDDPGVAGQGNPNPMALFGQHIVLVICPGEGGERTETNAILYDPSCGVREVLTGNGSHISHYANYIDNYVPFYAWLFGPITWPGYPPLPGPMYDVYEAWVGMDLNGNSVVDWSQEKAIISSHNVDGKFKLNAFDR